MNIVNLDIKKSMLLFLLFVLLTNRSFSQATDNLGNDLFIVKTKAGVSFPLTTTGFSFNFISSFDSNRNNRLVSYYSVATQDEVKLYKESKKSPDSVGSDRLHVTDIGNWYNPFFINLKVTNLATKSFNQFFSPVNQPTIQLEFGAIGNSVLKIQDWDKLKGTYPVLGIFHEFDFFYSLFVNTSCINYVDTTHLEQGKIKTSWFTAPKYSQVGLKANFNGYFNEVFMIAITGKVYYGLPLDTDPSYQESPFKSITNGNLQFYKPGTSTGKYGGYINDPTYNGRVSVSVPIFLNFIANTKNIAKPINAQTVSKLYLLPSYAPFGTFNTPWTHQLGCSLNLLSQGYGGINSTIVQAGGIGADLLTAKTHTGWGSPIFYVSGTFNLGSLVKQTGVLVSHEEKK